MSSGAIFRSALGSTGPGGIHPFTCPSRFVSIHLKPGSALAHLQSISLYPSSLYSSTYPSIHPYVHTYIHLPMVLQSLGLQVQTFQSKHSAPPGFTHLKIMAFREHQAGAEWSGMHFLPSPPKTGGDNKLSHKTTARATLLKAAAQCRGWLGFTAATL